MPKFNNNSNSYYKLSEELSEENINNTISISNSEAQNLENSENENTSSIQNIEESDDYAIEITDDNVIEGKKSDKKINKLFENKKKKYSTLNKKSKRNGKNVINNKNDEKKSKGKKSLNIKDLSKLDDYYEKLRLLISKNDFTKISFIILKLLNGLDISDKDDDRLFYEIKNIYNNINIENIIVMCLNILSSKISLNNKFAENSKESKKQEKKDEIPEINNMPISYFEENNNNIYEPSEEIEEKIERKKEKNKKFTLVKDVKNFKDKKYLFGKHYYNNNDRIYCFVPKTTRFTHSLTLYCCRRSSKCNAKCVVKKKVKKVKFDGEHNHNVGISNFFFYSQYPCLANKKWEHIQIYNGKNEEVIVIQS